MSASKENVRRLLRPRSVAFVGGSVAPAALVSCEEAGFAGPIYAVHPRRTDIDGRATYPSVHDLPEAPDAVFIAANAAATVGIVGELREIGAGGAACYAAGFSETGTAEGVARELALREASGELAVLGPNCFGLIDLVDGVSLWPVPYPAARPERGVAVILQSGNLGINVTMSQRSLPLAFVASVGNQAVLEISDLIDAYLEMDEVTAIGIYLEGLRDVRRFAAAAARALERRIPIAVCKAGSSELGRELALTHTASLAGSDELYDALFSRYGVARAGSVPELIETLKALTALGPLEGRRVFVFTCSGAESALAADSAAAYGIELPPPRRNTGKALAEVLPEFALLGNPLDYGNALWGQEEPLRRVFQTALRDPVDAVVLVIDYPLAGTSYMVDVDNAVDALAAAAEAAAVPAAVASVLPESLQQHARERMLARGVAPLQGLDEALAALAGCVRLGERLRAGPPLLLAPIGPPPKDALPLGERAAKELLAGVGVAVPDGLLVAPNDAPEAAAALGFPVVAKLLSPDLPHKAAAGAVALGLRDEAEVVAAVAAFVGDHPHLAIEGVLLERLVEGAVCELLVGARHDPAFGHVLVVGSGGSLVELVADVHPLLLPISSEEVEAAFRQLRVWPRLRTGDVRAAIDVVSALARLVESCGERLAEFEVNPLLVLERGAVAVDALGRMRPAVARLAQSA